MRTALSVAPIIPHSHKNCNGCAEISLPIRKTGAKPLGRWLVAYRLNAPGQVEIWAGEGIKGKNGPVYRVYPDPAPNYS